MTVTISESRRVTGPSLWADEPGVALELEADDVDAVVASWQAALVQVWPTLFGGGTPRTVARRHPRGATLFVAGPIEALLPLTDVNEWAAGDATVALDPLVVAEVIAAHIPRLADLRVAAAARRVPVLMDEDAITLGGGGAQLRLPRDQPLPAIAAIAWDTIGRVPVGVVTGTNGKTTTTRLAARMLGPRCGWTSSDAVMLGDTVIARGDYSGPEGSRLVVRHPDVEVAVLETARGGILRRGLAVTPVDVAVITNVAADHLGEHGVHDVDAMAAVKAVVARTAKVLVLGADDARLAAHGWPPAARVIWFGLDAAAPHVVAHVAAGGEAYVATVDGWLARLGGTEPARLVAIADVPVALGGLAPHNLRNALAAAALARSLGATDATIRATLRSFTTDATDNPGRGNLLDVGGVTVLLDFGHNAAAVAAVMATLAALRARRPAGARLLVSLGLPGDRRDDELRAVVAPIAAASPAAVYLRELHGYLRGRAPGEVPGILRGAFAAAGDATLHDVNDELAALHALLADARPGDIVALLPHVDPAVEAELAARGAKPLTL